MTSLREAGALLGRARRLRGRPLARGRSAVGAELPLTLELPLGLSVHRHGESLGWNRREREEAQGRRDSNPQPAVLETAALPVELLPLGVNRDSLSLTLRGRTRQARAPAAAPPGVSRRQPARRARPGRGAKTNAPAAPTAGAAPPTPPA